MPHDQSGSYAPSARSRLTLPASLSLLAGLNLAMTFGFQWLPVHLLGAGAATDALFFSAIVPQIILAVVVSALTSVLTPLLATADPDEFRRMTWTFAHVVVGGALVLNAILFAASPWLVDWFAPGFPLETKALATDLVRIQLIVATFNALLTVNWSAYYSQNKFIWVDASALLVNMLCLVIVWFAIPVFGVYGVAWVLVLRSLLQAVLLVPGLGRYTRPSWRDASGSVVLRRLAPIVAGSIYYKADPLVDRILASFAPVGQLSLLHLASQLYGAANQIVTKALINPVMPELARLGSRSHWRAFWHLTTSRLYLVLGLTGVASIVLVLIRVPLAEILGGGGRLTPAETTIFAAVLVAMVGVWLGGVSGQVSTTSFFAYGNTRLPTTVGVVGFTLGVPLKIFLFTKWGVVGVALATSIYTLGNAIVHQCLLSRQVHGFMARGQDVAA